MNLSLSQILQVTKDPTLIKKYIVKIRELLLSLTHPVKIMEFCGGHTQSLLKYGIDELFNPFIQFVHGPGCPVCVLSAGRLELALDIAKNKDLVFLTYGDLLRVPNLKGVSLQTLRAAGYEIKIVSHSMEALEIAKKNPKKNVIFYAIGFETTAPSTAFLIKRAQIEKVPNLKVISNHLLTPPVLDFLFSTFGVYVNGIIGPGHVSAILGAKAYEEIARKFCCPIVIAGFEPLDLLEALKKLLEMILEKNIR